MATLFSMLTLLCLLFFVKMLLLNVMVSSNIRACDLVRKMHIKPQEVNRIIDTGHTTKIDTIAKALDVLGKNLQLSI